MRSSVHRVAVSALLGAVLLNPAVGTARDLQTVQIIDAAGFSEPMPAATIEIPAGWRTQGGVQWNPATNCVTNKVRMEWRARSRDDLEGFELMPGYNWQVAGTQISMNPCPVQPFRSAREFLQAVVQQRRTGARVIQYRERPDMAQRLGASTPTDPRVKRRIDAGQMLIGYVSEGVEFREVLTTSVDFTQVQGNVVGGVQIVHAMRAPNGRLDFGLAERVGNSLAYERPWGEAMVAALKDAEHRFSSGQSRAIAEWHAREMARISAEGAADRAAIRAATARDVARINAQTNANTSATNDVIHRRTLEGIGEYNTYNDNGTTVRSSIHGGSRVLGNGQTYFSTNDPYFNPSGSYELQRVR